MILKNGPYRVPPSDPTAVTASDGNANQVSIPYQPNFGIFFRLDSKPEPLIKEIVACRDLGILKCSSNSLTDSTNNDQTNWQNFCKLKNLPIMQDAHEIPVRANVNKIGLCYKKDTLAFWPLSGEHKWNHLSNICMIFSTLNLFVFSFIIMIYTQITMIDGYGTDPITFYNMFFLSEEDVQYRSVITMILFLIMSIITVCMFYELAVLSYGSHFSVTQESNPYFGNSSFQWVKDKLPYIAFLVGIAIVCVVACSIGTDRNSIDYEKKTALVVLNIALACVFIVLLFLYYRYPNLRNWWIAFADIVLIALLGTNIYISKNKKVK